MLLANSFIVITSGRVRANSDQEFRHLMSLAQAMKKRIVLVLGPDGDDLLRELGEELDDCEIVFDPNFDSIAGGGLFSGLKAGLFAVNGAAFVIPLGEKVHSAETLRYMEHTLLSPTIGKTVYCRSRSGETQYPLLVTAHGVTILRDQPSHSSWIEETDFAFHDLSPGENGTIPTSP